MRIKTLSFLVVGLPVYIVEAGNFKWNSGSAFRPWTPPSETKEAQTNPMLVEALRPTSPPELRKNRRRGDVPSSQKDPQVCGYVYGLADSPFTCGSSPMACYSNTDYKAFGCCSGSECSSTADIPVQTKCFDSTDAESITTSIDGYTGLCTNSGSPYCMTLQYQDEPGYSVFGCTDSPSMTMPIYHEVSSSTASPSMAVASSGQNSTDQDVDESDSFNTNVGAIVGVVVGVFLGLCLISAALFLRRKPPQHRPIPTRSPSAVTTVSRALWGYEQAPQTPDQHNMPFQYQLPNFSADSTNTALKQRYSMSSYGMYDPSFQSFRHESTSVSPRSQSPVSPGGISVYSRRRPGSPLSESVSAYGISEVTAMAPLPRQGSPQARPAPRGDGRPVSSGGTRPASSNDGRPVSRNDARPASRGDGRPVSRGKEVQSPGDAGDSKETANLKEAS